MHRACCLSGAYHVALLSFRVEVSVGWSGEKLGAVRDATKQALTFVGGLVVFLACAYAYAVPITYTFTGTITDGSFEEGGGTPTFAAAALATTNLSGGLLTVTFSGDTNQVRPPFNVSDCVSINTSFPCAGGLSNSVKLTVGTETVIDNKSMDGTFAVFNNTLNLLIAFEELNADPAQSVVAFETNGTKLQSYGLTTDIEEENLGVFAPDLTGLGLTFKGSLVNDGGSFTIDGLENAAFQAATQSETVPEPGTLALLSLVFGAATLSLHIRSRQTRS